MCLIVFNWAPDSRKPLILAANRDEFHSRESLDAHYWTDHPNIFGGRDLEKNGTWLGLANNPDNTFRLAALTNYRSADKKIYLSSRGEITHNFLASDQSALNYAQSINYSQYAGFNGLFFDGYQLVYCHHQADTNPEIFLLEKGIYGLSNAKLDSPWPKVVKTKAAFQALEEYQENAEIANHFYNYLQDNSPATDDLLPETGVDIVLERLLSPAFIKSPNYGTRTSSVVIFDQQEKKQRIFFQERQFSEEGKTIRELITTLK